ncbi:MAG: hypothetical protein OEY94_07360 [Alphaproteobacteria bacterium]|nr:hypothetical protein [Alphaproteobacteria bacterium]
MQSFRHPRDERRKGSEVSGRHYPLYAGNPWIARTSRAMTAVGSVGSGVWMT